MIDQKFTRLVVKCDTGKRTKNRSIVWKCQCKCGNFTEVPTSDLRRKHTKSCGCLVKKHGHSPWRKKPSITYNAWANMIQRCSNSNHKNYKHYGGRGIIVCKRWKEFKNFLVDMGKKPIGLTLDRIDVNGDYCSKNCRWATWKQQANNKRKG